MDEARARRVVKGLRDTGAGCIGLGFVVATIVLFVSGSFGWLWAVAGFALWAAASGSADLIEARIAQQRIDAAEEFLEDHR